MFKGLLRRRPAPGTIMGGLALFIALGGIGYAATGGTFILGQANTATTPSSLSAPVAGGKALQLTNTSTTAGSTALGLSVAAGKAPFTVNSSTKVTNLNADRLDGLDSTAFLRTTGKAADSNNLDGLDSTAFIRGAGRAFGATFNVTAPEHYSLNLSPIAGIFVQYLCPADLDGVQGSFTVSNDSSSGAHVFWDNGSTNPGYRFLEASAPDNSDLLVLNNVASPTGDRILIQAAGSFGVVSYRIFTVHRSFANSCHLQVQGQVIN